MTIFLYLEDTVVNHFFIIALQACFFYTKLWLFLILLMRIFISIVLLLLNFGTPLVIGLFIVEVDEDYEFKMGSNDERLGISIHLFQQ